MSHTNGPGLLWQLLEFFGMTWPGHKIQEIKQHADYRCKSCQNQAHWIEDKQVWQCPNHQHADVYLKTESST